MRLRPDMRGSPRIGFHKLACLGIMALVWLRAALGHAEPPTAPPELEQVPPTDPPALEQVPPTGSSVEQPPVLETQSEEVQPQPLSEAPASPPNDREVSLEPSPSPPTGDADESRDVLESSTDGDALRSRENEDRRRIMAAVDRFLDDLETYGVTVVNRERIQGPFNTVAVRTRWVADQPALILYQAEMLALDGYRIFLTPIGPDAFDVLIEQAWTGQAHGVAFVGVDHLNTTGPKQGSDSWSVLEDFVQLRDHALDAAIVTTLERIGYSVSIWAVARGVLEVRVEPARRIRRIRVRGYVPLPKRDVIRAMSYQAQPGAIARGRCEDAKTLRRSPPNDACDADALVCRAWETAEEARLSRYLMDQGYLEAEVRVGFTCDDDNPEADLWVTLDKGRGFRVGDLNVTGNAATADHRWIRRIFRPTVVPVLPIPKRLTRAHVEDAKERVATEYAELSSGGRRLRSLELPYPGVRVETNFESFTQDTLPATGRRLPLSVDIQLGRGVKTSFEGNERVATSRLRPQLQLFERREPATAAAAARESENLRAYYQTRGFTLAEVEGAFDDQSAVSALDFTIDEGPRVRIREVEFPATLAGVPRSVLSDIQKDYRKARKVNPGSRWTDAAARSDLGAVIKAFNDRGYLCAQAQMRVAFWRGAMPTPVRFDMQNNTSTVFSLDTELRATGEPTWIESFPAEGLSAIRDQKRAGLHIRVEVVPGPRVVTSERELVHHLESPIAANREVEGSLTVASGHWGAPRMLRAGPLRASNEDERPGSIPLTLTLDRDVERSVKRNYRREGYPLADVEVRWVYTDAAGERHAAAQAERLTDKDVNLCRVDSPSSQAFVDTELWVYEGRRAQFGRTLIEGNFKTHHRVLARELAWDEGDPYDRTRVDLTRRRIEAIGVTETLQIDGHPTNCELDSPQDSTCTVHHVVTMTESKDRFMDISWGLGFATLDPFYVFASPSFPNMGGSAWDLQLDTHIGTGLFASQFCSNEDCYERSGRATLSRQRIFASPLGFEISGSLQRRATPARGIIDSALGEVRLTLPIGDRWQLYWSYLIQAANISKGLVRPTLGSFDDCSDRADQHCQIPSRSEAIVPDRTGAFESGAQWSRVDNAFNPESGMIANVDVMLASPYFGGLDWFLRLQGAWQHFIPLPSRRHRWSLRYTLRYAHAIPLPNLPGSNTTVVPEIWRFFGGGTVDLGIRGIEPQTMLVDIESIEASHGTTILRPTAQGGQIRALGSFALQYVSLPNFLGGKLAHSVFVDLGVLTQRWRDVVPSRDIRRSVGLNFIKWDINIVTVSLGYAVLVPDRILPGGNVRPTDDPNGRFVFDVGATF